ncbi:MAG: GDP-mannose-dependent alpha-(1-6)-phosphatidylinositol monomannoside mannosyltransferase [Chloroflexi bacterium ADurb.Bin325]|nr:MAG: GDP-mannose-dependent alpha-(1-6)-phosphatidylinositol monomannoside mannosyltransferase [Chloroflexi bacterium ADurb.Bin325]
MRVSLLNLNLVARDAIGRSIMAQARFFQRRGDIVQIFVEQPPEDAPADIARLCRVVTPAALRRDPEGRFAASDLYIYHYGGYHGLMDSISTIDGGAVCFYYHNVTPPDLWNWEEDRPALRRGVAGVRLAAQADFVIGDSEYNLRQLAQISGAAADRLHAVPLPVDVSAFHPGPPAADLRRRYRPDDAPVLLYVGRMAPNKRIDLLVELLAAVRRHPRHPQPAARLLLVGDYDSAPAYRLVTEQAQARARALGVAEAIRFTGRVDPADYYRLGSVYVTTSQHEGFCLPLIEAMASGVPVVASAGAAIPETVGDAGVLVAPRTEEVAAADGSSWAGEPDVPALADAVAVLLDDPARVAELAERGLARAASYTLERYEESFAAVIDRYCVGLPLRVQPTPRARLAEAAAGPAEATPAEPAPPREGAPWPELNAEASITMPEYTVRSKLPLVGGLIVWVRRNLTSHLKEPYVDRIFQRQQGFNLRAAWIIEELTRRLDESQARGAALAARLESLQQLVADRSTGLEAAHARGEQTALALQRLESAVARLEARLAEAPRAADGPQAARADGLDAQPQAQYGINYLRCNLAVGGDMADEMALYRPFVSLFEGAAGPVLDLGCGQGAFLRVLGEAGIAGYGVDVDRGMVDVCHAAGLAAEVDDVFAALERAADASLGGVFSAHVIEHLPRVRLSELAALCWRKLRPGAALVWITPHGGALSPLHATFYKDLTHTRPLHPDLLRFLLEANGFRAVETRTLSDMPEELKLALLPADDADPVAAVLNRNIARLNELIFGHVDCAVIGRR